MPKTPQRWNVRIATPSGAEVSREITAPTRDEAILVAQQTGRITALTEADDHTDTPGGDRSAAPGPANPDSGIWIDHRCIKAGVLAALWSWTWMLCALSAVVWIAAAIVSAILSSGR